MASQPLTSVILVLVIVSVFKSSASLEPVIRLSTTTLIDRQSQNDDNLYCSSWRLAVETDNAGSFSQIPSRCRLFIKDYMTGRAYDSDCEVVNDYSLAYASTVQIASDGKDAWVFDIDETLLSNLPYYLASGFGSEIFNETSWDEWVNSGVAPAIPSSLKLYNGLKKMGFKIFVLTGRGESQRRDTAKNLELAGFTHWERLILSEMKIEYLDDVENNDRSKDGDDGAKQLQIVKVDGAKRVLVGAGARILFYPTLLYNVFRNKIQSEFRWWDEIEQFLFLGAVPFPRDVRRLKQLGVGAVITLNEPFETLVSTSLYHAHGIDHLVIPTRDYMFAPSVSDINRAVDFIHMNASCGRTTYVHCKAGRGRSTTVVLCYLVEHKQMTPAGALEYVRSRRPRVLLAPSQWKAVVEYSMHRKPASPHSPSVDAVMITKADLEGYHSTSDNIAGKELVIVPRMVKARPMIARLSCLFASFKVSGQPVSGRLHEARAC